MTGWPCALTIFPFFTSNRSMGSLLFYFSFFENKAGRFIRPAGL
jgi:hypothetical protein